MHITLPALIFIFILLTWSPERISEAGDGLIKLALWLAGAIAAGVALWFSGKFLLAHPFLTATLVGELLVLVIAFWRQNSKPLPPLLTTAEYLAANPGASAPVRLQPGEGRLFPGISDTQRAACAEGLRQEQIARSFPRYISPYAK